LSVHTFIERVNIHYKSLKLMKIVCGSVSASSFSLKYSRIQLPKIMRIRIRIPGQHTLLAAYFLLMESWTYGTIPGELDMAIRRSLQGELDKRVAGGEARDDGLRKFSNYRYFDYLKRRTTDSDPKVSEYSMNPAPDFWVNPDPVQSLR
jgi:hypothetical protein